MPKNNLQSIIKFFQTDIWRINQDDLSPVKFLLLEIAKKLLLAIRFFTTKGVMQKASALTYSTLLAIVPITAVVFAIARGFGYSKYIEVWFRNAFESQPQVAEVIIGFVNSYLVHTKSGVFLGIGLIFMLYTVLMLVSNVEDAFNEIWQVKKPRSIFRTFTDYLASQRPVLGLAHRWRTVFPLLASLQCRVPLPLSHHHRADIGYLYFHGNNSRFYA